MLSVPFTRSTQQVFLVLGATDMRKAVNGLCALVYDFLEMDVLSGNFFVFCNKNRTLIKILYWERNGFCLWQKRLEKHRFIWPKTQEEVLELDMQKLRWLLEGLNPFQLTPHANVAYKNLI